MTPEEINAKALELAIMRTATQDRVEIGTTEKLAKTYREFIADTSWSKKSEQDKDLIGKTIVEKIAPITATYHCNQCDIPIDIMETRYYGGKCARCFYAIQG